MSVKYPGTADSNAEAPYDDFEWGNPSNVCADDGKNTSITHPQFDLDMYSYVLRATNFGIDIPGGAQINGIEVELARYCDSGEEGKDVLVQLTKNGTARVGNNKATNANWPTSPTVYTYGGATDLWGTTWTATEITTQTFGVHLAAQATADNADIYVEFIRITVYYSGGRRKRSVGVILN